MAERLQKLIASSGIMSRRAAEEVIQTGRVMVNGKPTRLGDSASENDIITIDGKRIPSAERKRYYLLNKPRGYVCSMHDEKGRKSVRELLPESFGRIYPVGRLDMMSEGLLLMTNDGEFAYQMTHPSCEIQKTYRTIVNGSDLDHAVARMQEPFVMDGDSVRADKVIVLKKENNRAVLDIVIHEGKNRQIRRMCEQSGLHVMRLVRIREGIFSLGKLASGKYRALTEKEIQSVLGAGIV